MSQLLEKVREEDVELIEQNIMDGSYCSMITCQCKNVNNGDGCGCSGSKNCCKQCFCKETAYMKVKHENDGSPSIWHDDHLDYIVNGVLHFQTDKLCYNHGIVSIQD